MSNSNQGKYEQNNEDSQYVNQDNSNREVYEVFAKYINQTEVSYRGNRLIEALPPVRSLKKTYFDMINLPYFSPSERNNSAVDRIHAVYRLQNCMIPLPNNIKIDLNLSLVLRRGYVNKFIETPEYIRNLKQTASCLTDKDELQKLKKAISVESVDSTQSAGFLIIGISGGGKTTAIKKSMSYYPRIITHVGDGDRRYIFRQIPFIKVECPCNGSIKALCVEFFYEIDKLLGTNYGGQYGKQSMSIDRMIIAMSHLAQLYGLGALIIDEIQHLRTSKTGEVTLNVFVSMMNRINLPIVYIGTYKAINDVLVKDFRHARRSMGIGNVEWKFMDYKTEYDMLINQIWKYQWTKEEAELTEDIKSLIFRKSIGITDRVIKLFAAVQVEAITSGEEKITKKLIEKVADEHFLLTKNMIRAFNEGDIELLIHLEDLITPDITEMFKESKDMLKLQNEVKKISESNERKELQTKRELIDEIITIMSTFDYDIELIKKIATKVVSELGIKSDHTLIKKEIAKRLLNSKK